jgi:hypothetical protein
MSRFEWYGDGVPGVSLEDLTGWLIVIEGTDGVGRTTHVTALREHLERLGYAVAETGLSRSDLAVSAGPRRATPSAPTPSICSTRPTLPTGSSTRSFPRCGQGS